MLDQFHPLVRAWFTETLGEPSAPQRGGWPAIASGDDTLILAPTGTGKTLSAFLYELNALITEGQATPLANAIHLLYISPLKALSNDIQRNLELPLAQLRERFNQAGELFPEIRVAVRTGDTSSAARARMLRKTPHILITTPESLHILLTNVRGRTMFSALRAVIIDEIHAVAGTKRGAHLALMMSASDPANVYSIPLEGVERDSLSRPRGSGALLVTSGGRVVLSVEGRGRRISTRVDAVPDAINSAISALVAHFVSPRGSARAHDVVVETIDGEPAASSRLAASLLNAGFRREALSLRYYAAIR